MTEAEWLTCDHPRLLIGPVRFDARSRRRLGLFAVGCIRATDGCEDPRQLWEAAEAVERAADSGDWAEADRLGNEASPARLRLDLFTAGRRWAEAVMCLAGPTLHVLEVPMQVARAVSTSLDRDALAAHGRAHAAAFRDVFGNPFRPVAFDPAWRTITVVALANLLYDSRDFSPMPVLADALQDAGCDSDEVLDHCRGPGPHVRGCWLVDLVLGREGVG